MNAPRGGLLSCGNAYQVVCQWVLLGKWTARQLASIESILMTLFKSGHIDLKLQLGDAYQIGCQGVLLRKWTARQLASTETKLFSTYDSFRKWTNGSVITTMEMPIKLCVRGCCLESGQLDSWTASNPKIFQPMTLFKSGQVDLWFQLGGSWGMPNKIGCHGV